MTILNRLRSAESGSRELDAAIEAVAKDWHYPDGVTATAHHYSTSIDASLALVEKMLPEHRVAMFTFGDGKGPYCLIVTSDEPMVTNTPAATAPLAILTALFTALEAKDTTP